MLLQDIRYVTNLKRNLVCLILTKIEQGIVKILERVFTIAQGMKKNVIYVLEGSTMIK